MTKKLKSVSVLLATAFIGCNLISCNDEDNCNNCDTEILERNVTFTHDTDINGIDRVHLFKHDDKYVIFPHLDNVMWIRDPGAVYYYVCNEDEVRHLLSGNDTVAVNVMGNIRKLHPNTPSAFDSTYPQDIYKTLEIEVIEISKSD